MHVGDAQPVPGHADVAAQAFGLCLRHRFDHAARTMGLLPLIGFDEIVQLDQVDVVNAQPFEGQLELGACT